MRSFLQNDRLHKIIYTLYVLGLYHPEYARKSFNDLKDILNKDSYPYLATTPDWVFYDPINKVNSQSEIEFTRSLKLSPEKAKEIKSGLKILIITSLQSPYLIQSNDEVKPTVDRPYASKTTKNEIVAQIVEIWLYNSYSGEIITRWPTKNE